jgi:hypothetical protein
LVVQHTHLGATSTGTSKNESARLAALITQQVNSDRPKLVTNVHATCQPGDGQTTYTCEAVLTAPTEGVYEQHWSGSDGDGKLSVRYRGNYKQISGPTIKPQQATCTQLSVSTPLTQEFDRAIAQAANNPWLTVTKLEARARMDELAVCIASRNSSYRPWAEVQQGLVNAG